MVTSSSKARLASDIEEGVHAIKDDVHEMGSKLKNDLSEIARDAGRKARQYVDSGEQSLSGVTHAVAELIREKPVQSGLIAAGIGFALGLLLRRK
jgi:ElaB/YqjD/DUF883 family membrane-anchored ribosome-binding protein